MTLNLAAHISNLYRAAVRSLCVCPRKPLGLNLYVLVPKPITPNNLCPFFPVLALQPLLTVNSETLTVQISRRFLQVPASKAIRPRHFVHSPLVYPAESPLILT